jgi:hypothetical protein
MTTPDFEKMFDIEDLLNSEDQVRYTEAVRAFANAVETIVVHLGISRDDPLCSVLVKVAEDLVRARRDAENDAIQYAKSIKESTALLHATQRAQLGPRLNAAVSKGIVAYCCLATTIAGILGFVGGWYAHEGAREPPSVMYVYLPAKAQ